MDLQSFENLLNAEFEFQVDGVTAYSLVGIIQLAMRNKEFTRTEVPKIILPFCDMLTRKLLKFNPELEFMINAGWNPNMDIHNS